MTPLERIQDYIKNHGYGFHANDIARLYGGSASNYIRILKRLEEEEVVLSEILPHPTSNYHKLTLWHKHPGDPVRPLRNKFLFGATTGYTEYAHVY